ncbi:MAG: FecR domain-containing protein [Verrucomicrobia bacterium]|nr:FecR domain-containing protein [Verrucomicrobiota bacterium]
MKNLVTAGVRASHTPRIAPLKSVDSQGSSATSLAAVIVALLWVLPATVARCENSLLETLNQTNRPGRVTSAQNRVDYLSAGKAIDIVHTNQFLDFGEGIRTAELAKATVQFLDLSHVRVRDRTRLEIVSGSVSNQHPTIELEEGEIYVSSRGSRGITIPFQTKHGKGIPHGTEYVIRATPLETEIVMFDGEVEFENGVDRKLVASGSRAVSSANSEIRVFPILMGRRIVQWWVYYPGILDPAELGLEGQELSRLRPSLGAYELGNLNSALTNLNQPGVRASLTSESARCYEASLLLACGSVEQAKSILETIGPTNVLALSLRAVVHAFEDPALASASTNAPATTTSPSSGSELVKGAARPRRRPAGVRSEDTAQAVANLTEGQSPSWLLAESFRAQADGDLHRALHHARAAVAVSKRFGFGWSRVAELEFSFGNLRGADEAAQLALSLTPENAQAYALRGFLLASTYRVAEAIKAFDRALELDPGLGNAWLGRGLCKRRVAGLGWLSSRRRLIGKGWLDDLQTAAAVEPRRSLLRSYVGKSFAEQSERASASKELGYAKRLDPEDPTPWLYSAFGLWENNRINEAMSDLESSIALNDNRAVYRSSLLLDQDRSVRSASLARIYRDAALPNVGLTEASRAVSLDYANFSSHQFLAESYDALRDPTRFNLRNETVWFNELLMANILSPPGAGLLSQTLSQQEYGSLFESEKLSIRSATEYRSDGEWRQTAAQSGQFGGAAYSLDLDYESKSGRRSNETLDRKEWFSQVKQQVTDRDCVFLMTKVLALEAGDNFQRYDPSAVDTHFRLNETQTPLLVAAWHREWQPGSHTTLMAGRLAGDLDIKQQLNVWDAFPDWSNVNQYRIEDLRYRNEYQITTVELNQIHQTERQTWIAGVRLNDGEFKTSTSLEHVTVGGVINPLLDAFFAAPIISVTREPFLRLSPYCYHSWLATEHLLLTTGLTFDHLRFPDNFRFPPINAGSDHRSRVSPKLALQWEPSASALVRSVYTRGLGGVSLDESFRLEPSQLAGFPQAFRSIISESEAGSVAVPAYEVIGIAGDYRTRFRTYLGLELMRLTSRSEESIGAFDEQSGSPLPTHIQELLRYKEHSASLRVGQLLGRDWLVGAECGMTRSLLVKRYPIITDPTPAGNPSSEEVANLRSVKLRLMYHNPTGLFAQCESSWLWQDDMRAPVDQANGILSKPPESVMQLDLQVGFRFNRRRGEVAFGVRNLTGQDYRLTALTPIPDLPRSRVFTTSLRWRF